MRTLEQHSKRLHSISSIAQEASSVSGESQQLAFRIVLAGLQESKLENWLEIENPSMTESTSRFSKCRQAWIGYSPLYLPTAQSLDDGHYFCMSTLWLATEPLPPFLRDVAKIDIFRIRRFLKFQKTQSNTYHIRIIEENVLHSFPSSLILIYKEQGTTNWNFHRTL